MQGINHNEPAVGVLLQIVLQLHDQPVRQLAACHSEVQAAVRLVCQTKKPVLYAEKGILKAQVQHIACPCLHLPEWQVQKAAAADHAHTLLEDRLLF